MGQAKKRGTFEERQKSAKDAGGDAVDLDSVQLDRPYFDWMLRLVTHISAEAVRRRSIGDPLKHLRGRRQEDGSLEVSAPSHGRLDAFVVPAGAWRHVAREDLDRAEAKLDADPGEAERLASELALTMRRGVDAQDAWEEKGRRRRAAASVFGVVIDTSPHGIQCAAAMWQSVPSARADLEDWKAKGHQFFVYARDGRGHVAFKETAVDRADLLERVLPEVLCSRMEGKGYCAVSTAVDTSFAAELLQAVDRIHPPPAQLAH